MQRYFYPIALLIGIGATFLLMNREPVQTEAASQPEKISKQQRIEEVLADERRRTMDPALGRVPTEEMLQALEETRRLQRRNADRYSRNELAAARFREQGPNNIGGRTRVILIDDNDPSRRKVTPRRGASWPWRSPACSGRPWSPRASRTARASWPWPLPWWC